MKETASSVQAFLLQALQSEPNIAYNLKITVQQISPNICRGKTTSDVNIAGSLTGGIATDARLN
jgi:hypothetical protein